MCGPAAAWRGAWLRGHGGRSGWSACGFYCDALKLPEIAGYDGRAVLYWACCTGLGEVAATLIERGADIIGVVEHKSRRGTSWWACCKSLGDVAATLIARGADIGVVDCRKSGKRQPPAYEELPATALRGVGRKLGVGRSRSRCGATPPLGWHSPAHGRPSARRSLPSPMMTEPIRGLRCTAVEPPVVWAHEGPCPQATPPPARVWSIAALVFTQEKSLSPLPRHQPRCR